MAATLVSPFDADDVALSTTAALIYTSDPKFASVNKPETIIVQNLDASIIVTVGPSNVTSLSHGVVLATQYDSITIEFNHGGIEVYAIAASGTPNVVVARV